jgi:gamma-glutamyl hercynylcysteine S-oxide hydrolase
VCRHLAYVGPPVSLSTLLLDPPHSLLRQSWAPRDMRGGGTINADGFGVGWHTSAGPVRYRRGSPMWSAPGFAELARVTMSGVVLAAVRSATVGMPVHEYACAPFGDGDVLFSHNGRVFGWPQSVAKLAERLPVTDLLTLDAPTDAAFLWALVRHRLRGGADPAAALAATVSEVDAAAPGSRLNLLLTDGRRIYATTAGHSLWMHPAAAVASEPFDDDPAWLPVPDRRLVVADPTTHTVEDL